MVTLRLLLLTHPSSVMESSTVSLLNFTSLLIFSSESLTTTGLYWELDVFLSQDARSFCLFLVLFIFFLSHMFGLLRLYHLWDKDYILFSFLSSFSDICLQAWLQPLVSEMSGENQCSWHFCKGFCNKQCWQASPWEWWAKTQGSFQSQSFPPTINIKK